MDLQAYLVQEDMELHGYDEDFESYCTICNFKGTSENAIARHSAYHDFLDISINTIRKDVPEIKFSITYKLSDKYNVCSDKDQTDIKNCKNGKIELSNKSLPQEIINSKFKDENYVNCSFEDCSLFIFVEHLQKHLQDHKSCHVITKKQKANFMKSIEEENIPSRNLDNGDIADGFLKDNDSDSYLPNDSDDSNDSDYQPPKEFSTHIKSKRESIKQEYIPPGNLDNGDIADGFHKHFLTNDSDNASDLDYPSNNERNHSANYKSDTKESYICCICHKEFSSKLKLSRHKMIHSTTKPFKCSVCEKTFSLKSQLKKHTVIHDKIKQFVCTECGRGFSQKAGLDAHFRTHTGEKPFSCDKCSKSFVNNHILKQHMFVHSGVKPFKCSVCEKAYTEKRLLGNHMLSHTGIRPFLCNVCGKSFVLNRHLKSHIRSHKIEKTEMCHTCGTSFKTRDTLRQHMLIHKGVRAFPCPHCSKSFVFKHQLKRHLFIHTGERPYSCKICGNSFAQQGTLKNHMRVHKENAEYKI